MSKKRKSILEWIAWEPYWLLIIVSIVYLGLIHFIPFWNEHVFPCCCFLLKISSSGITDLFIPTIVGLTAYWIFELYRFSEVLKRTCTLIEAELKTNCYIMKSIKKYIIGSSEGKRSEGKRLESFNNNYKYLKFKSFHLQRFDISPRYFKYSNSNKKDLYKYRGQIQITVNAINSMLEICRHTKIKKHEFNPIIDMIKNQFSYLEKEQEKLVKVINDILEINNISEGRDIYTINIKAEEEVSLR